MIVLTISPQSMPGVNEILKTLEHDLYDPYRQHGYFFQIPIDPYGVAKSHRFLQTSFNVVLP